MLPDYALSAVRFVIPSHSVNGFRRMEMARCKWNSAFLRPPYSGCTTSKPIETQLLHTDCSLPTCCHVNFQQQLDFRHLHQRRDLEAQCRNDAHQHSRTCECCRARRTGAGQRASFSAVFRRPTGYGLSSAGHGIRNQRCRARCTYINAGRTQPSRATNNTQSTRTVLCATALYFAQALIEQLKSLNDNADCSNTGRLYSC